MSRAAMPMSMAAALLANLAFGTASTVTPPVSDSTRFGAQSEEPPPFSTESDEELARYRAIMDTSFGPITVEFLPDKAPNHVRNFLRLASLGAYDGTSFHRIIPGYMIQTGLLSTRSDPPPEEAMKHVRSLEPELNDTAHVKGTVSMALPDEAGGGSTSFFICTAESSSLDGRNTAFGRVVEGLRVVDAIQAIPSDGGKPFARVNLVRVRLERSPR